MRSLPILVLLAALAVGCATGGSAEPPKTPVVSGGVSAPAPAGSTSHVIQRGETLYSLAKRYYGRGADYGRILAANPRLDPKNLPVGTRISIPRTYSASAKPPRVAPRPTNTRPVPRTDTRVAGWSGGGGQVRLLGSTEIHSRSCPKVRRAVPEGIVPAGPRGGPRCPICR